MGKPVGEILLESIVVFGVTAVIAVAEAGKPNGL
jgi:hypothetical protein